MQVEAHHLVERVHRHAERRDAVGARALHVAPRGVDEHVHAPPRGHEFVARVAQGTVVEHVRDERARVGALGTQLRGARLGRLAAPAEHGHAGAGAGEPGRHRAAEGARAAGDDGHPPGQVEERRRGVGPW